MTSPTPENRSLAKYLHTLLGGSPSVIEYWDDPKRSSVDVFRVADVPVSAVSTYATLGLSDCPIGLTVEDVPLRVEFTFALMTRYEEGMNYIATCAFSVINDKVVPKPGVILPRVLELYRPDDDLKHMMLCSPSLWNLETQNFPSKKVAWLQLIPISDAERNYALSNGSEALEDIFEREQVDVTDLDRPSVLK